MLNTLKGTFNPVEFFKNLTKGRNLKSFYRKHICFIVTGKVKEEYGEEFKEIEQKNNTKEKVWISVRDLNANGTIIF